MRYCTPGKRHPVFAMIPLAGYACSASTSLMRSTAKKTPMVSTQVHPSSPKHVSRALRWRRGSPTPFRLPVDAGFTISGHILRNESILHPEDEEYEHLPLMMTKPLAIIQLAIKHENRAFLATPVVHEYLRAEWVGGGSNEIRMDRAEMQRIARIWIVGWPFAVFWGFVTRLCSAFCPPFLDWYTRRLNFQLLQTHERMFWGLLFLPGAAYTLEYAIDLTTCILLTTFPMMPFRDRWGEPVFGLSALFDEDTRRHDWYLFFLFCIFSAASMLQEMERLCTVLVSTFESTP